MKPIIIIMALVGAYLFYPTYDLGVKRDPFVKQYAIIATNFITEGRCVDAAVAQKAEYYQCTKKVLWTEFFSAKKNYNPAKRYDE